MPPYSASRSKCVPFFRSIQGLRGVAATLVVCFHYRQLFGTLELNGAGSVPGFLLLGNLASFGSVGVSIFFVISGFVIGLYRFQPGRQATVRFAAKRLRRILPLYWLLTL